MTRLLKATGKGKSKKIVVVDSDVSALDYINSREHYITCQAYTGKDENGKGQYENKGFINSREQLEIAAQKGYSFTVWER